MSTHWGFQVLVFQNKKLGRDTQTWYELTEFIKEESTSGGGSRPEMKLSGAHVLSHREELLEKAFFFFNHTGCVCYNLSFGGKELLPSVSFFLMLLLTSLSSLLSRELEG